MALHDHHAEYAPSRAHRGTSGRAGTRAASVDQAPAGVRLPFAPVRVRGNRAFVAGHGPLKSDGTLAGPFGKVPTDVSPEDAYASARLVCLAMLGSLQRALGDLDRITA